MHAAKYDPTADGCLLSLVKIGISGCFSWNNRNAVPTGAIGVFVFVEIV